MSFQSVVICANNVINVGCEVLIKCTHERHKDLRSVIETFHSVYVSVFPLLNSNCIELLLCLKTISWLILFSYFQRLFSPSFENMYLN